MTVPSRLPDPLFIVGSGRSGTTLLASLLNKLPLVHITKETGFISRAIPLLEDIDKNGASPALIGLVNSWLAAEGWRERASTEGFGQYCARTGASGAAAFIHYVWQLECDRDPATLDIIGDNTPAYVWAIAQLVHMFPNARFIHMVRDPRDVAASMMGMKFGANTALTAALEWQANVGAWMAAERIIAPELRMELRYEDLCRDPQASMVHVARFLGQEVSALKSVLTDPPAWQPGFGTVAEKAHHRLLSQAVSPSRIGRHVTQLSKRDIELVESVTQHLMLVYGYESEDWHLSPLMEDRRLLFTSAYAMDIGRKLLNRLKGS